MFDKFLKLLRLYATLSETEVDYLKQHIPLRTYKKNELVFTEGRVSKTIYFVVQGCLRLFYTPGGKDKTAFFYTEGQFICAGESYTFQVPARENYQAIEDTVLMHFDKQVADKLVELSPTFEVIARIATENELITCQKIIASFVTQSPENRYLELVETNGALFQRVPQQYIASFLGVSPETLSRIKKRVLEKIRKQRS